MIIFDKRNKLIFVSTNYFIKSSILKKWPLLCSKSRTCLSPINLDFRRQKFGRNFHIITEILHLIIFIHFVLILIIKLRDKLKQASARALGDWHPNAVENLACHKICFGGHICFPQINAFFCPIKNLLLHFVRGTIWYKRI